MPGKRKTKKEILVKRMSTVPQLAVRAMPSPSVTQNRKPSPHGNKKAKANAFRQRLYKPSTNVSTTPTIMPFETSLRKPLVKNPHSSIRLQFSPCHIIEETVVPLQNNVSSRTIIRSVNKIREEGLIQGKREGKKISQSHEQNDHLQKSYGKVQRFIVTICDDRVTQIDHYPDSSDVVSRKMQCDDEIARKVHNVISKHFFPNSSENPPLTFQVFEASGEHKPKNCLQVPRYRRTAVSGSTSPSCSESGSDSPSPSRRQALCSATDKFDSERRFLRTLHKKF